MNRRGGGRGPVPEVGGGRGGQNADKNAGPEISVGEVGKVGLATRSGGKWVRPKRKGTTR